MTPKCDCVANVDKATQRWHTFAEQTVFNYFVNQHFRGFPIKRKCISRFHCQCFWWYKRTDDTYTCISCYSSMNWFSVTTRALSEILFSNNCSFRHFERISLSLKEFLSTVTVGESFSELCFPTTCRVRCHPQVSDWLAWSTSMYTDVEINRASVKTVLRGLL